MLQPLSHLPAAQLIERLQRSIIDSNVVIGAPPGAGKSTVLPLALLASAPTGKILLMQPRRVVVRSLAHYLARILNEPVGKTIGYRVRGESNVSNDTKLEIITEGILSRMIQSDPELSGISMVIFDEFHERSIHSDFGLALALEIQTGLRDDLRLVVMSATLDIDPLLALMTSSADRNVTHLHAEGRAFPVDIKYAKDVLAHELIEATVSIARQAVRSHEGDVLVFLPGIGAINAVFRGLSSLADEHDIAILTLHGGLNKEAQTRAISCDSEGRRKIILATNIAETSLTIEGVKVVVDSMWENKAHYHASSGFTELTATRISRASATQRAGRAGRVSAGVCYRLCSKSSFERLSSHSPAQIEQEDLSRFLLETYSWGTSPEKLALLTQPTAAQQSIARANLTAINALNNDVLTAYGRELTLLPCHPNLAHMLVQCKAGVKGLSDSLKHAMRLAAPFVVALSESQLPPSSDTNISAIIRTSTSSTRDALTRQAKRYAGHVGLSKNALDILSLEDDAIASCIALAFPKQVAYYRQGSYKFASGKGGEIEGNINAPWLTVLHGQHIGNTLKIRAAQPIDESLLNTLYSDAFTQTQKVSFNPDKEVMEVRNVVGFFRIELASNPVSGHDKAKNADSIKQKTCDAWLTYLSDLPYSQWPLTEKAWQWWYRVKLAEKLALPQPQAFDGPEPWPSTLQDVLEHAKDSLLEKMGRVQSLKALQALPWNDMLNNALSWPQQDALATCLPTAIQIPTKRNVPLYYHENGNVYLSAKMQEMYSQATSITLAQGRVTVLCELLSPAGRPLQTTGDLGAFWQGSYKEIQKEMKGRYPKHFWPDDPATAIPTNKTKKAMG
ncbi:ATP-dependent helicase HrpB [Alteromonas sp. A079]|uniref:ATP-dependent helicase HrpB n=1 Tax=Alteromonas sp. A079 TaxID=3410268 RepID=UPI003BA13744